MIPGTTVMSNSSRREALRGAEEKTFDILVEVMTPEQWRKLLRAPLEHAAAKGNRDIARKLVGAGAEVGDALHAAVRGGHEELVNDLLEKGAPIATKDTRGCTPLHAAAGEGTKEMVQLLLLKGARKDAFDSNGSTPLYYATLCDRVGAALTLLTAGANVSLRCGDDKETVLHVAARHRSIDIMRAAMKCGVEVDAIDRTESTPLHSAAYFDSAGAIDVLVEAGASIEARNVDGCTPLHCAAHGKAHEASLSLLKNGAQANAQNNYRSTPLHVAMAWAGSVGAAEMVDSLLRSGADETVLNKESKAAADMIPFFEEGYPVREDVDRVRRLLANAPADRAWRRRCYLVLYRSQPDRVQHIRYISGANVGVARTTLNGAEELETTEFHDCAGAGEHSPTDGQAGDNWAVVMARVLGMQEEGIFRAIVGNL